MVTNWRAAIAAASGIFVLAACSSDPTPTPTPALTQSPSATTSSASPSTSRATINKIELSEAIDHVHGLVATKNSQVVAGTHSGARHVTSKGKVSAPGDQRDDLMGMTGQAGTDILASSGHPGHGSQFPNPMGLITSTDAGTTWKSVSLQGQADFHALAISGKDVIGYGGGAKLQVSADGGRTWDDGAALQTVALAFSNDRILATTEQGLQSSTDGGKTFQTVKGAPALALISAGQNSAMLGLDAAANAWRSIDSGTTWDKIGLVGDDVQAIAALDNNGGYAISQSTLYVIS